MAPRGGEAGGGERRLAVLKADGWRLAGLGNYVLYPRKSSYRATVAQDTSRPAAR